MLVLLKNCSNAFLKIEISDENGRFCLKHVFWSSADFNMENFTYFCIQGLDWRNANLI